MKYFLIVALILSCSRQPSIDVIEVPKVPSEQTQTPNPGHVGEGGQYDQIPEPLPSAKKVFTSKINSQYCDDEQNIKLKKASEVIAKLMNNQEFKNKILNFKFNGKTQFNWNENMSNEEIFNHLFKGAEALSPVENYQMDINVQCYYSKWTSTIGYTTPDELTIYVNMKYHYSYNVCQVANNVFHEWTHKMGFDHSVNWNYERDFTVPYATGDIVEEACKLLTL